MWFSSLIVFLSLSFLELAFNLNTHTHRHPHSFTHRFPSKRVDYACMCFYSLAHPDLFFEAPSLVEASLSLRLQLLRLDLRLKDFLVCAWRVGGFAFVS